MCVSFGEGLEGGWRCSHLGPENDCLLQITASSCWNAAGGDWPSSKGAHLSLYLTVQRQKSRKSSCSRAPSRCQNWGQDPGTSDLEGECTHRQVLCRGAGVGCEPGGNPSSLIRQASPKGKTSL